VHWMVGWLDGWTDGMWVRELQQASRLDGAGRHGCWTAKRPKGHPGRAHPSQRLQGYQGSQLLTTVGPRCSVFEFAAN